MAASVVNLLLAVALLELGGGLQGILIPVRGELTGFPTAVIGALGTIYYVGFVAGCLLIPRTIRRIGHIRSFSALAAIAASTVLLFGLFVAPWAWLALRFLFGVCFAGLFMVIESWLNDRATSETRGRVLGLYMVVTWTGVIGGKLLYAAASPETLQLFAAAAIFIALSLVPLALAGGAAPSIPRLQHLGLRELYRTAPIGLVGCIGVGLANGAFWTFSPLYAQAHSDSALGVSLFMSACVVGSALTQWPIGRLSDRIDRRWAILGTCLASVLAGGLLVLGHASSGLQLLGLAAFYGAASLSIYSLCVAHANDRAEPSALVDVSSHLLFAFGLGAIVGPFLAGLLIASLGIAVLFAYTLAIHAVLALFVLVRIRAAAPALPAERISFVPQAPVSHATQAILELHPGAEPARRQAGPAGPPPTKP